MKTNPYLPKEYADKIKKLKKSRKCSLDYCQELQSPKSLYCYVHTEFGGKGRKRMKAIMKMNIQK